VLRAFCVVEWIMAVENCFSQKEKFSRDKWFIDLYIFSFSIAFPPLSLIFAFFSDVFYSSGKAFCSIVWGKQMLRSG
jgi:hypothetical protein